MQIPSSRWLGTAERYEPPTGDTSLAQGIGRILQSSPNSFAGLALRRAMFGGMTSDVVAIVERFDVAPWTGEDTVGESDNGESYIFEDNTAQAMSDPTVTTTEDLF